MKNRVILLFLLLIIFLAALYGCENAYKLSFSQEEYTVISGIEFVPEVKIRPRDIEYELTSSNITIAKIKDKTTIITLREGICDITVNSGKKSATSKLYVSNDIEYDSNNVKFAETATITFIITNYDLANLKSENYGMPVAVVKGGYAVFSSDPYIKGYIVHHWYEDRACTKLFDDTKEITGNITLFAYLEQRETSYIVSNGLIAGLTYDNLPHSVLTLPETTENGTEIVGIADNAFYGDSQITEVNIPHTYKTIGDSAFAGCKNLTAVHFTGGESLLEVVGINAFGVTLDKDKNETASCEKFAALSLPNSVYEIGAYAFYKCANLVLNGIPSGVEKIEQYAFAYTKINNVNFINITQILEGAFFGCPSLTTVTNTHNVTHCYQFAFKESKLYTDAEALYDKPPRSDSLAVFYADTIVIGTHKRYGTTYGSGDIALKTSATLIADKAFDENKEIIVYLNTQNANNVINSGSYDFVGFDLFKISDGTILVVPQDKVDAYKARYPEYKGIICYEEIIEITTPDVVNTGTHKIFVFEDDNHTKTYYYRKYTGNAVTINLNTLGNFAGASYRRISSFAFSNITSVNEINLGNVQKIALMAITSSCNNLTRVVLKDSTTPPILEDANSFQIADIAFCRIIVRKADRNNYLTAWSKFETAKSRVVGE